MLQISLPLSKLCDRHYHVTKEKNRLKMSNVNLSPFMKVRGWVRKIVQEIRHALHMVKPIRSVALCGTLSITSSIAAQEGPDCQRGALGSLQ